MKQDIKIGQRVSYQRWSDEKQCAETVYGEVIAIDRGNALVKEQSGEERWVAFYSLTIR